MSIRLFTTILFEFGLTLIQETRVGLTKRESEWHCVKHSFCLDFFWFVFCVKTKNERKEPQLVYIKLLFN